MRRRRGGRGRRQGRAVHLRHPQGAARRGPRRLRRAPARPAVPRRRLDGVGRPAAPRAPARRTRCTVALVGKYVDLPDAYLSVTEALRAGGFANDCKVVIRWVTSDDCQTPEGAARRARRRRRGLHPRRLRRARHRGQARRGALRPGEPASRRSGCAWACSAWSSSTPATSPASRAPTRPSSTTTTPHPVIATMADQRRRRRGRARHGRHHAARALPGQARRGLARPRGLRTRRTSRSATGTATRSTTPTASSSSRPGLVFSGTSPDGRLVEYVELPRDVHPVLRRHPGAPGVPVPPGPRAPAVRRPGRGRGRPPGSRAAT